MHCLSDVSQCPESVYLRPKLVPVLIFVFLSCAVCIYVHVHTSQTSVKVIAAKLQFHECEGNPPKHVKGAQRKRRATRPNQAYHPEAKATDASEKKNQPRAFAICESWKVGKAHTKVSQRHTSK